MCAAFIDQSTDFLQIQSVTFNPDPPVPGDAENASFVAKYTGDTTINAGTVTIQTLCQGVQVFKLDVGLCDVLKCPIKPGSTLKGSENMIVPSSAPPCSYETKVCLCCAITPPLKCHTCTQYNWFDISPLFVNVHTDHIFR